MTEPKSECCGADWFYWVRHFDEEYVTGFHDGQNVRYCPLCHKPCSIAKLPKASKVKEEK